MDWMFYPEPKLHLTLRQLQQLRRHLFGEAAAALSDRLSDVELVQLLIVSAGHQQLACQQGCCPQGHANVACDTSRMPYAVT